MKQHHSQCVKNLLRGTVRLTNLMTRLSASARRHLARAAMAVGVLLAGATAVNAAETELYSSMASSTAGDYFKAFTVDGTTVTVATDKSIASSSGDYYVSLGSTPSNSSSNYIELVAASGTFQSVSFAFTGNGDNKTCQPVLLGWKTAVEANAADYADDGVSQVVSAKGKANAQWFTYDLSGKELTIVRIYRGAKKIAVAGAAQAEFGNGQTLQYYGVRVELSGGGTTPTLTVSPNSLTGLTKNIAAGGATSTASFTLSGSNLTANAVVTAPEGFEISKNGTTGWATTQTYTPTAGSITDQTVYVRLSATTTGTKTGTLTVTSTDATTRNVSLNGTVVDLTPLPTPTVGAPTDATAGGFTANWTAVTGALGYTIHVYKSSTGAEVTTVEVPSSSATSAGVTGLEQLTSYYFKVEAKGNGSSSGNSALSAASSSISTTKGSDDMVLCISEGFEELVPTGTDNSSNCSNDPTTPTVLLRYMTGSSTSNCAAALLGLSSGNWPSTYIGAQGGDYTHNGSTRAVYLYRGGYIQTPTLVMPKKIEFYVRPKGSIDASKTDRGFQVLVDGTVVTSGVLVNDVEIEPSSTTLPSFSSSGNGIIRLGSTSNWFKVTVPLTTSNTTVQILSVAGNSASDIYVDDISVYCDPQELTISPELTGLNYVEDLGPSQVETIILTGSDLPVENGTATLTGPSNFEVSLDGGATWGTGTKTFPYTGGAFTRSVLVRLPAGLTAGATGTRTFTDLFQLNATGYQKTPPTINVSGKVTLFPVAVNCGETVDIVNLKGTEATLNLVDAANGENWTTSGSVSHGTNMINGNVIQLESGAALISPSISTSEYDLTSLSFDVQPSSGSGQNSVIIQLSGPNGYLINDAAVYSQKAVDHYSVDLSEMEATGSYTLRLTPNKNTHYIWNVKVTGTAKRKFSFSPATLTGFQSYPECASEVQSFKIYGTCLDDNSSINLESSSGAYEFSLNGTSGWSSAPSYSYTGEFPVSGMTVYVRQKSGVTPGTVQEDVKVTNNHKGFASFALSGEAASSTGWTPTDGTVFNFQSAGSTQETFVIPIEGDKFCQPPTATTSCPGLTLSNCKEGTYANSTTFSADYTDRNLYLRYTPGTLTNCAVNITAGGETHTIRVNWNGATAIASGVQPSRNTVTIGASGYGSVGVTKKGSLDDKSEVTVTSTKFEFSMGNPQFGDFVPMETFLLSEMQGTLYVRPKAGTASGDSESVTIATAGGGTATVNITVE